MQSMQSLTKKDLIDLIDRSFPDEKHTIVASFFSCGEYGHPQQVIVLHKMLEEMQ